MRHGCTEPSKTLEAAQVRSLVDRYLAAGGKIDYCGVTPVPELGPMCASSRLHFKPGTIGSAGIAEALGMDQTTWSRYARKGIAPESISIVGHQKARVWRIKDVIKWAERKGMDTTKLKEML